MQSVKASYQPEKNQPAAIVLEFDEDDCVPTDAPPRPSPPGILGNRSCELSVERIENKVAFDALLPVPIHAELETVRDALGSFVAWPEELISYTTTAIKKNFEMLGQAVIASYMAHLHTETSQRPELAETFAFIDPGSTFNLNGDFEAYIVNRLKEGNPDRLFFLPHNQKAVKSFNSETGRGNRTPPKAKFLSGSPKQPGGHECAYVVMRYMKEIINDTRLTFATKWLPKTRATYNEAQLDEIEQHSSHTDFESRTTARTTELVQG
ncbi:hypothetical protein POM88_001259 [Heracleum sosnowskyi]|uniref:Uncharacterized protein n=1 Tax=Heracleum sosnowskyi TaxID=360622 RepID=A0AAD8JDR2_9APIA|nr:hypothetical protein POM88_001259 [Heracleum sosnowskyi]